MILSYQHTLSLVANDLQKYGYQTSAFQIENVIGFFKTCDQAGIQTTADQKQAISIQLREIYDRLANSEINPAALNDLNEVINDLTEQTAKKS